MLLLPVAVFGAALDDQYLAAFGAQPVAGFTVLEKALLSSATPTEVVRSGTPLRHALKRDWSKLQPATQKILAKALAVPTLSGTVSGNEPTQLSSGGHFLIHYTTSGADAPDVTAINKYSGLGLATSQDWVTQVGDRFEAAYAFYLLPGGRGYHPSANFPGKPLDVYLLDLASQGAYGFTQSGDPAPSAGYPYAYTAYIEIDKDFTNGLYTPTVYTPLQSLEVTSVHEFHHTIQYGYNYYFDVWYAEATSTWYENELYPEVKQLYSYIPGWFSDSTRQIDLSANFTNFAHEAYGRWLFNRYLAEAHNTLDVVRSIWEAMPGITPPSDGSDIPMVPVVDSVLTNSYGSSLGSDLFGFAKRIYTRDWATHTEDLAHIPTYTPVATFSSYPVSSSASTSVTLPHYSFAFYKFTPSAAQADLTITLSKTSGIKTAVFLRQAGAVSEIAVNKDGGSYTVTGFGSLNSSADEVVLLAVNTVDIDNELANFATDGKVQQVADPGVSGSCGGANNTAVGAAPTANLCSVGITSAVLQPGGGPLWTWSCTGGSGGATASCSAPQTTAIENVAITSGNGSITAFNFSVALDDPILAPAAKPSNFVATGAATFSATVTPGAVATFQIQLQANLQPNPVFYKIVGSNWVKVAAGDYTLNGSTLTLKVTDNGPYDNDPTSGKIQDPLVVGFETAGTAATSGSGGGGKSGCFIATAAYGSYLHPKVAELRSFRDRYLLTNAPGRLFVALYYRLSPPIARVIAGHEWMRVAVRGMLTPVVLAVEHPSEALLAALLIVLGLVRRQATRRVRSRRLISLRY